MNIRNREYFFRTKQVRNTSFFQYDAKSVLPLKSVSFFCMQTRNKVLLLIVPRFGYAKLYHAINSFTMPMLLSDMIFILCSVFINHLLAQLK